MVWKWYELIFLKICTIKILKKMFIAKCIFKVYIESYDGILYSNNNIIKQIIKQ